MKIEQQSSCATQENASEDRYKGPKWPPESRCIDGGALITQNATAGDDLLRKSREHKRSVGATKAERV